MQWPGLLPLLFCDHDGPQPQVLLIHLGRNDLGFVRGKALIMQVIEDFKVSRSRWPDVWVIWSTIVPRMSRRNAIEPRIMKNAKKNANREIGRAKCGGLGQFLPHPELCIDTPELYLSEGVHLSELGLDIFLRDLQQGLQESLGLMVGASAGAVA